MEVLEAPHVIKGLLPIEYPNPLEAPPHPAKLAVSCTGMATVELLTGEVTVI
jgi:hypothetical protein